MKYFNYFLILLVVCLSFTGCTYYRATSDATWELTDAYLDAALAAEKEKRKRKREDAELALEARRVAALEELANSIVYVNDAREFHLGDCLILSRSKVKTPVKRKTATELYSACSHCAP